MAHRYKWRPFFDVHDGIVTVHDGYNAKTAERLYKYIQGHMDLAVDPVETMKRRVKRPIGSRRSPRRRLSPAQGMLQ